MKTTTTTRVWAMPLAAMLTALPMISMLPQAPVAHAQTMGNRVTLREGQQIQLKLSETLRSNRAKVGDEIRFYVAQDIMGPNGEKLIFKGARAGGEVTEVRSARRLGRKGVLTFTVDYLIAIDGTRVPLRAEKVKSSSNARRRIGIGAATVLLSPAALLIRGRNITVKPGTIVNAYIDRRAEIRPTM